MKRRLVVGNWKLHQTLAEARALALALRDGAPAPMPGCTLVVAPPYTALAEVARTLDGSGIAVAGQACFAADAGAYTGAISAPLVLDAGARFVLVGHSERRARFGESVEDTAAQLAAARRAGLCPILCVGETRAERDAGQAIPQVMAQLHGALAALPQGTATAPYDDGRPPLAVAYEPVWAIGTGASAGPEVPEAMHAALRAALHARLGDVGGHVPLLYGGSVKPATAAALWAVPEVDGLLVGGASLDAEAFLAIASA